MIFRTAILALCALASPTLVYPQEPFPAQTTVISGFSGTQLNLDHDTFSHPVNETVLDSKGVVARLTLVNRIEVPFDGQNISDASVLRDIVAEDTGQISALAFDDLDTQSLYLGATSEFGLNLVIPDQDDDGYPERVRKGHPDAIWMDGQFGPMDGAGPGSIYRLSHVDGDVELWATLTQNGQPNSGAGIGDLAWHDDLDLLFASDLDKGLIFAFDQHGTIVETYDHGTNGRLAAGRAPVLNDPTNFAAITSEAFRTEDPKTWGFANPLRRVRGLATLSDRLFYAVAGDSAGAEIWSVALNPQGALFGKPQFEFPVIPQSGLPSLEIADIVVGPNGQLILAEHPSLVASHDYSRFVKDNFARILSYYQEIPDDPDTPLKWILSAQETPVGQIDDHQKGLGGVSLGVKYDEDGRALSAVCGDTLWATGEHLLKDSSDANIYDGAQISETNLVRSVENTPFAAAYLPFPSPAGQPDNTVAAARGFVSDIEVICSGRGGSGSGSGNGDDVADCKTTGTCGGSDCHTNGTCPPPGSLCMDLTADVACIIESGQYGVTLNVTGLGSFSPDMIKLQSSTPGVSVATPSPLALNPAMAELLGATPSQQVTLNLCAYAQPDDPNAVVDCCRAAPVVTMLPNACPIQ